MWAICGFPKLGCKPLNLEWKGLSKNKEPSYLAAGMPLAKRKQSKIHQTWFTCHSVSSCKLKIQASTKLTAWFLVPKKATSQKRETGEKDRKIAAACSNEAKLRSTAVMVSCCLKSWELLVQSNPYLWSFEAHNFERVRNRWIATETDESWWVLMTWWILWKCKIM
jgi:hypothetical protein